MTKLKARIESYLALDAKRNRSDHWRMWRESDEAKNQSADFARKLLVCINYLEKIENVNFCDAEMDASEREKLAIEALEEIGSEEK